MSTPTFLDEHGNWRRRAVACVPDVEYGKKRLAMWESYKVRSTDNCQPRPVSASVPNGTHETARLEDAPWASLTWGPGMDLNACAKSGEAIHTAYETLTNQRIGASTAAWVNPLSRTNLQRSNVTGDVYVNGMEPRPGPPSNDEMRLALQNMPGGVRLARNSAPARRTFDMPPPPLIAPADVGRWPATPNAFPVYVAYPGFGAGLAVRHIIYTTGTAPGSGALYFAVKKFTPLGPVPGEDFALGLYAVPEVLVTRMSVAVAQLFPAENIAVIDDFRGDQYSIPFLTLRTTKDPRYEIARRALLLQYPYLLTDLFATRLRTEPPPDMRPGGAVPPALIENPSVMIAPPANESQAPSE